MPTETPDDRRVRALADWQAAIGDQDALLKSPETYTSTLVGRAKLAMSQGVITAEDLGELLELADAAYEWAVEERITRGLVDD
ncbi:hypothetical protein [Pseudomonas abietaniphila]|uniref:Uncharacterized protein n=1 Tax=Pseudomonas abietaniphila TaxID=89065 RepID=A0A1G8RPX4_9PSED|nr:hypothetical protein [Pseudomonas abietaniphila]SDJ19041.1 hypothetical protein SAMN05216605_12317 [Pseudomonas abietaniphila]